jgi:thiol-disulfide isomerase/thioredoxin
MTSRLRARSGAVRVGTAALLVVLALSGCAEDPQLGDYNDGSGKNYVGSGGAVLEIDRGGRAEPVQWEGVLENGEAVSSTDTLGQVSVLNFWYAACAPCRAEAPDLESLHQEFADQSVAFLGVNLRDQSATAIAFAEEFGVTYPSVIDANDANVQLAYASTVPAKSVPTTLVLDREGRVAARILGRLATTSILESIIRDTIAEAD